MNRVSPPVVRQDRIVLAPDQLIVPGVYRLLVVDGQTVLVKETDPRKILMSPAVQIISTDPMGTDLAIQPALLPQEVTEEIAKNRAQTDAVMRAIPQLVERINALGAEEQRLIDANAELMRIVVQYRQAETAAKAQAAAAAAAAAKAAATPQAQPGQAASQ
jgi:hypothetical protein